MLGHHALLYSSIEEFLVCAAAFVRAGLARGDAILVASPNAERLADFLDADIEVVDDQEWHHVPAWTIGLYARKSDRAARRGVRLRALTELRWGRPIEPPAVPFGDDEWMRYESVLNHALAGLPIELCCAYDRSALGADVLQAASCTHPSLLGTDGVQESSDYLAPADFFADHPQPAPQPIPSDAVRLDFGASEIPAVRRATLDWARAAGMAEDDAQEFLIAVYEIVSNAVEHGGGRGVGWFWSDGHRLLCEVWSQRRIPEPLAGYRPPGTAQERGRGLWLARQICEQVLIVNTADGATVQLAKTVQ